MDELRIVAKAHYERATEEYKGSVRQIFGWMDKNCDGRISLEEFKERHSGWDPNGSYFNILDENGDGTLDFHEFLTFYYMYKAQIYKCRSCREILSGNYLSCSVCLGSSELKNSSYDVCCKCYARGKFAHQHSAENFLDSHARHKLLRETLTLAQITPPQRDELVPSDQLKVRGKRDMNEIRGVAKAYYEIATKPEKEFATQSFQLLDKNKDERISLEEYKEMVDDFYSSEQFFKMMDENGDGTIAFDEFLMLYYMRKVSISRCDGCKDLLIGCYFSCLACLGNFPKTYDLCHTCLTGKKFVHQHSSQYFLDSHARHKLLCKLISNGQICEAQMPETESTKSDGGGGALLNKNGENNAVKYLGILVQAAGIAANVGIATTGCIIM